MSGIPWRLDYAGKTVLTMEPNGVDSRPNKLSTRGSEVLVPSGARILDKDAAKPGTRYEFQFLCETRQEMRFLRDFFDECKGMAKPFWFPTWNWDFEVRGYGLTGAYYLWVAKQGYGTSIFPLGAQFRQFLIHQGNAYRGGPVLDVSDDSYGTEKLNFGVGPEIDTVPALGSQVGPLPYEITTFRPLWLRYGRFDVDEIIVETAGSDSFTINLALVELPDEVT